MSDGIFEPSGNAFRRQATVPTRYGYSVGSAPLREKGSTDNLHDQDLYTDIEFAYIKSIRSTQPISHTEYEQLNPVILVPVLCRHLT